MAHIFCILIVVILTNHTGHAMVLNSEKITLEHKLESNKNLVDALAEELCWDLEIYQENASPTFSDECTKKFLDPYGSKDNVPPALQVECLLPSKLRYNIETSTSDLRKLVVLTPINMTLINLPYDLMDKDSDYGTISIVTPGKYKSWVSLFHMDGSHSLWRRGPDIVSWNYTGEITKKTYEFKTKIEQNVINGTSYVKVQNSWNSYDEEDNCFNVVNICDGRPFEKTITPRMNRSYTLSSLPLDADCEVRLTGRHGTTRMSFRTPSCKELPQCIGPEKVQNLSLEAFEGNRGWTVVTTWEPSRGETVKYNVTLFTENFVQSLTIPGSESSAVFYDIEDKGLYTVAVGAVKSKWTVYTSVRAKFPEPAQALGAALGGWWAALVALTFLLTVLLVLWRRRANSSLPPYFSDFDEEYFRVGLYEKSGEESGAVVEDQWEVRPERVSLHEVVGEGAFGVVRRATLAPTGQQVAVKMLKEFPSVEEVRALAAEIEVLKCVGAHPHVVSLVGVCSGRRPRLLAEYCARGDLLSYLRSSWDIMVSKSSVKYYNNNITSSDYRNDLFKCKPKDESSKLVVNKLYDLQGLCDMELTTRDILSFCRQIAMGMEFLASNRLIHRDLAARNVLVCSDRTLKIADFGLSRDVYEDNHYKQKGDGKLPVKWMALESLLHRIYTTQSDVWSFGVVMWEVSSVGASPYAGESGARVLRLLRAGRRLPPPAHAPPALYELMLWCWRANARARPTFGELHARLDALLQRCADHYLSLEPTTLAPPALPVHKHLRTFIKNKLKWSKEESYERPFFTAKSNHYSSPPHLW